MALPEIVAPSTTGQQRDRAVLPQGTDGHPSHGAIMPATLEPLALSPRDAAALLSISKRSLSRLIAARKIIARKDGARTLVDVASIKAYYAALPMKTDHAPSRNGLTLLN